MKNIQSLSKMLLGVILLTMAAHTMCDEALLVFRNSTDYPLNLAVEYADGMKDSEWISSNGGWYKLGKITYDTRHKTMDTNITSLQVASRGTTYTQLSVNKLVWETLQRLVTSKTEKSEAKKIIWRVYGWDPINGWKADVSEELVSSIGSVYNDPMLSNKMGS